MIAFRLWLSSTLFFIVGCLIICHAMQITWLIEPSGVIVYFGIVILFGSLLIERVLMSVAREQKSRRA